MPGWGFLLLGVFMTLGLMKPRAWSPNAVAAGVTIVVLLGVAATDRLLLG